MVSISFLKDITKEHYSAFRVTQASVVGLLEAAKSAQT